MRTTTGLAATVAIDSRSGPDEKLQGFFVGQ